VVFRQKGGELIIKICGITSLEDALHSVRSGANALGFNFYHQSPRYIEPDSAARIMEELPDEILMVAVMVVDGSGALQVLEKMSPQVPSVAAYQLHGLHQSSQVPKCDRSLLIATSAEEAEAFSGFDIVIDSSWGRGERADWTALEKLEGRFILSGGLEPENVGEAIRLLRPRGVDVCSGVEQRPGLKDPEKVSHFVKNAIEAGREHPPSE